MYRMHAVHSFDQRCSHFRICRRDVGRRSPQGNVDVLGIPAGEQNMFEVGRAELGEYWRGGCVQPFCVSNAVKCWIGKLLVDGDAGAVAQKEGLPTFRADVCPSVDFDSVHVLSRARIHRVVWHAESQQLRSDVRRSCRQIHSGKSNGVPLDQHCLVDQLADRGMQQQSTRVICKRIAAPNLGAQIGVDLVHVSAA